MSDTMQPKYKIGDQVWRTTFDSSPAWVPCPDCCGSGRLRVILGDDTVVSVDCQNCERGYLGPQGRLQVYNRAPRAELVTVKAIRLEGDKIEYGTTGSGSGSYSDPEDNLFDNESDALVAAVARAEKLGQEERDHILKKEKDTRSWAWNANYHRKCIRRAQSEIEYHTKKLNVASLKAKEARAALARAEGDER